MKTRNKLKRIPRDEFYYIPEPPQINIDALKYKHLCKMFNDGIMNVYDAVFYKCLGYEFVMESGGHVLAIIPPGK